MTFQPYQKADEEIRRQSELPLKLLKKGASLGSLALGGGSLALGGRSLISRILPLLDRLIPEDLAKKGLFKVDKRLGKFINSAEKSGVSFDKARDFIKEKIEGSSEEMNPEQKRESDRVNALQQLNQRSRNPQSEFSPEALTEQFQQGQQQGGQGKQALLQTMQQITEQLRRMRGNG